MENEFRFLEFEGIQIATFIEGHNEAEHVEYLPHNVLFYVRQGQLNIRDGHKLYTLTKNNFGFVRKFSELTYFKSWDDDEDCAIVSAMILQDDFIQQAIKELGHKIPKKVIKAPFVHLENNSILLGLYESLMLYITENQVPDKHLMFLKTKEALLGINFEFLKEVNAFGINSARSYGIVDYEPEYGDNFYRLKVIRMDGSFYYSVPRKVNFDISFSDVIIYPNPTNDFINITLKDFAGNEGTVEIFNNLGQLQLIKEYSSIPGVPATFDVSNLVPGIYTVSIKIDNQRRLAKQFIIVDK